MAAIQRASTVGLIFDFDGPVYEGAVLLYSGSEATIRPRYIVSRSSLIFSLARAGRQALARQDNPFDWPGPPANMRDVQNPGDDALALRRGRL